MRCDCCDRPLNDYECTVKLRSTGEYANTCNSCRKEIGSEVEYIGRTDLEPYQQAALTAEASRLLGEFDEQDNLYQ